MSTPKVPSSHSNGDSNPDGFDLAGEFFFDGPWDTTARPPTADRSRQREADRENIERLVEWAKREQEQLTARRGTEGGFVDDVGINFDSNPDESGRKATD